MALVFKSPTVGNESNVVETLIGEDQTICILYIVGMCPFSALQHIEIVST